MRATTPLRGRAAALAALEAKSPSADDSRRTSAPDTPRSSNASKPTDAPPVAMASKVVDAPKPDVEVPRHAGPERTATRRPAEPSKVAEAQEMGSQLRVTEASRLAPLAAPRTHVTQESKLSIALVPHASSERESAVIFEAARREFKAKAESARSHAAAANERTLGGGSICDRLASLELLWREYENEGPSYPPLPEDDMNVPSRHGGGVLVGHTNKREFECRVSRPWPGEPDMIGAMGELDMPWAQGWRDLDLPPPPPLKEHPAARAARRARELGTSSVPSNRAREAYCVSSDAPEFAATSRGRFDARPRTHIQLEEIR